MTGGAGSDLFQLPDSYTAGGGSALRITDFSSGTDLIDLSAMDADAGQAGDQAFIFVGDNAFSNTAGELRYWFDGTDTTLQGDTDGDGPADFTIVMTGDPAPVVMDFVL